jgi:hypothetical protein
VCVCTRVCVCVGVCVCVCVCVCVQLKVYVCVSVYLFGLYVGVMVQCFHGTQNVLTAGNGNRSYESHLHWHQPDGPGSGVVPQHIRSGRALVMGRYAVHSLKPFVPEPGGF